VVVTSPRQSLRSTRSCRFFRFTSVHCSARISRPRKPGFAAEQHHQIARREIVALGTSIQIERVVREAGLEGVVANRIAPIYEPGVRSRNWVKVRFSKRQEFVIGRYKPAGTSPTRCLSGTSSAESWTSLGKVWRYSGRDTRRGVATDRAPRSCRVPVREHSKQLREEQLGRGRHR
jgi:hypothetical protein